jgi:hypothetical protein
LTYTKDSDRPNSLSDNPDIQGLIPPNSIRGLSLGGIALIGLYATIVISSCFPVQLLRPAWQLQVGATLINSSPLALIGLMTLHLTADLEPEDPVLVWRRSLAAQLAVLASVGFLMLILLLPVSAVRQQQQQISGSASFVRQGYNNLKVWRQVVAKAANTTELHDQLLALNGPVLNDADRQLPLPVIKAQVNQILNEAEAQLTSKKQQLPPSNLLLLLPSILRNAVASLFLAVGFAGLSRRPGTDISLLMELQQGWYSSRIRKSKSRRKNSQVQEDLDYLGQISGEDEVK